MHWRHENREVTLFTVLRQWLHPFYPNAPERKGSCAIQEELAYRQKEEEKKHTTSVLKARHINRGVFKTFLKVAFQNVFETADNFWWQPDTQLNNLRGEGAPFFSLKEEK